jgi:hypothetical protein
VRTLVWVFLALLIVGGVIAYLLWQQRPQNASVTAGDPAAPDGGVTVTRKAADYL